MKAEYTTDIQGTCDICLSGDCGPEGVRVIGTPVAVGKKCVAALASALPKKSARPPRSKREPVFA